MSVVKKRQHEGTAEGDVGKRTRDRAAEQPEHFLNAASALSNDARNHSESLLCRRIAPIN